MWRDTIELGQIVETITHGEPVKTTTWTTVYAGKKSVSQKEFYESRLAGLKPELVFEIRAAEFNNHDLVRYKSKIYSIIRTYEKNDLLEVYVSAHTGSDV